MLEDFGELYHTYQANALAIDQRENAKKIMFVVGIREGKVSIT